ncbi:hypothetical protein scyTo_0017192, partial [Scyliorhinus torazame]|nr:hypothetical protein [Scyliorhinus torazame]
CPWTEMKKGTTDHEKSEFLKEAHLMRYLEAYHTKRSGIGSDLIDR